MRGFVALIVATAHPSEIGGVVIRIIAVDVIHLG